MDLLLRISSTNLYQRLVPTEQLLVMPPMPNTNANATGLNQTHLSSLPSLAASGALPAAGSGQIQRSAKKMASWSAEEWRAFIKRLCEFLQEQVEDFHPAFRANKALTNTLARAAGAAAGTGAGAKSPSAAAAAAPAPTPKKNSAEICIIQILQCFAQGQWRGPPAEDWRPLLSPPWLFLLFCLLTLLCLLSLFALSHVVVVCFDVCCVCVWPDVQVFLAERVRGSCGLDEGLLSLVVSLVRVQAQLMDSGYADFWSSRQAKIDIAATLPSVTDICTHALNKWIEAQKIKVEGIKQRYSNHTRLQATYA